MVAVSRVSPGIGEVTPAAFPEFERLRHLTGPARTFAGVFLATGTLVPAWFVLRLFSHRASRRIPSLYLKSLARSLGVTTVLHGEPAAGPVLHVSNHLSWVDIPVLGGELPAAFVAKREVAEMGLVGRLADMGETIYVDRADRHGSSAQAGEISARLRAGGNVILFPEGTSNDGLRVLPFKSSLFAAASGIEGLRVQPVSLAYTALNGLPITRNRVRDIAWIGDMELAPHLLDVTRLGRIRAEIRLHPPVEVSAFSGRKALARYCQAEVTRGYSELLRGAE
jgi:1-acyl-sn-glycerol-3-phosphate acyltransferase